MNRKVKVGVIGVGRGSSMMNYCKLAQNAELVAVCDKWEEGLKLREREWGDAVAYYTDYDEFLKHDMDAVVLANYANEHAPFAVKAMRAGKHVLSEVLPVQTMKEAVELIEAVEETGRIYAYAENYCYMPAPREMRRLTVKVRSANLSMAKVNMYITVNLSGLKLHMERKITGATACIPLFTVPIPWDRSFILRVCAP